jgi:hypothetical protein
MNMHKWWISMEPHLVLMRLSISGIVGNKRIVIFISTINFECMPIFLWGKCISFIICTLDFEGSHFQHMFHLYYLSMEEWEVNVKIWFVH